MKIKIALVILVGIIFTGCNEISSEQCREMGYNYGTHNGMNQQVGRAKIEKDIVEIYNNNSGNTYYKHITEAPTLYKLED